AGSRKAQNLARSPDRPQNKVPRIPQDIPITSRVDLSETQLRELAKGPYRSPLPSNLLKNSKIRQFLAQFRVNSEEDLQDIRKAMRVRREARKRLRLLIRESSESRDT
ncbi:MAG: hypothetical protein GWM98_01145, partial [Nitrospinaceae bacterium]|nr:hypothetical protein [Nitrospinaceae bacterium]NIR53360.1 hypothetical protein [Nitrospinaceae bacterium]NIS83760.1 hypothetical protein [Nitrospinaceae bacterium]NIT80559.1 hypothetical protein [Nitrospinaceae bacterium]NIU42884.1 hypothetical protein [Nitrospinaceae bacterium]